MSKDIQRIFPSMNRIFILLLRCIKIYVFLYIVSPETVQEIDPSGGPVIFSHGTNINVIG